MSKLGAGPDLAAAALAKLKAAHELVMASGGNRQTRMAYHLGALMAREQLVAQDPAAARRLLLSVAGVTSMSVSACVDVLCWKKSRSKSVPDAEGSFCVLHYFIWHPRDDSAFSAERGTLVSL